MKLIDRNVIFSGTPGTRDANCCFPSLISLSDGTLVSTWRSGSAKDSSDGVALMSRSADDGSTWSAAEEIPLGPYADKPGEAHYAPLTVLGPKHLLAAVMWVDRSNPALHFFNPQTEGLLPTVAVFCESRDGGNTWDNYRQMDQSPYYSPMPITGPVLALGDGRLACQFEVNKNYNEPGPWRHVAAWKISSDGGRTWPECVEIANDPTGRYMYWDARYALRSNGFCQAAFWTYDRVNQRDATIHLSESNDYGRTWNRPRDTNLIGQVCHPVILNDGRLLLIIVDRFHTRTIRAVISDDDGCSFQSDTVIYEHLYDQPELGEITSAEDYLQKMDAWTFGRVDGIAQADGVVFIIFYAGNPEATNIHFVQLSTDSSALPPTARVRATRLPNSSASNFEQARQRL
jgi:hypothetical protein